MRSLSINSRLVIVFLSAVLARVVFHHITGFIADDAFITFRYARNLAAGLGFVYNQGEPVMGTSTPLYTLLLGSLAVLRIPPTISSLVVSIGAGGLTAVILYKFALSLRFTRLAFVVPLAYILFPRSLVADTCGMETALFTMLVAAAFYFQHRGLVVYAIGMATLAAATRPEGAFLLVLLLVFDLYYHRELCVRCLIVPFVLLVPWLVFSWLYFGSPVPNSIPGKLALYSHYDLSAPWQTFAYLMGWHTQAGWPLTVCLIFGAWWLNKKQNFGWIEMTWLLTTVLFYTFSSTVVFFWYVAPICPVYLLLSMAVFPMLFDFLSANRFPRLVDHHRLFAATVAAVMLVTLVGGNYSSIKYHTRYQESLENVHKQVGNYLFQFAAEDDLVAAEDIGYIGYYSHRRILDRDGLVTPETRVYNRMAAYEDLIYDFEPDWVVARRDSHISGFISDSLFLDIYHADTVFGQSEWRFDIFRRNQ